MSVWPTIFGMGSAVGFAGLLAVPVTRRLVFGSVEHDWLGHQLEFERVEPDNFTVRLKRGPMMRAYRIGGMAYDTKPEAEQVAFHRNRSDFIHACGSLGVTVRVFGVKRHKAVIYPAAWPSPALQEIGDAEAKVFRNGYELRWYVTLQATTLDRLEQADEKLHSLLSEYQPSRVSTPERAGEDCPLTGFLNFLTCGDLRDDLRPVSSNISANLPAADLTFEQDGSFVTNVPTPFHHRMIVVTFWPEMTSGHLMHELMALPFEIEVSQVASPISRTIDLQALNREAVDPTSSDRKKEECAAAGQLLKSGDTTRFMTQLAIIVRGKTPEEVERQVTRVSRILGNRRVSYVVETKGAPVAWFNRTPDHESLLRPLKLFAENVAALWPFESAPTGLNGSQYGPAPVRSFLTGSGQAYAFQFQCVDQPKSLGNFVVFAPAGSGKSTLIVHLLGGLTKFDGIRSYTFDSQEGTRFMIETMGGVYQNFDRLALNPLDVENTRRNRQRLSMMVRSMLGDLGKAEGIEEILVHAAEMAFQLPLGKRTFNDIFPMVFPRRTDIRRVFSRWVIDDKGREGLYSHIFNAPRDTLSQFLAGAHMVGINMNEALDDPILGAPVVSHIVNAIERQAREGHAKGFAIFIDEAANLLRNPAFCDQARVMYREYRKLFGSVGMAFQDPKALLDSGIAEAVLDNTSALIFFPNPLGNRETYKAFPLNEEHLSFIFDGGHEGRKVLLVKNDPGSGYRESAILDIDLAPLGDALRFYRSGPDAVRELEALQAKWGDEWPARI